MTVSSTEIKAQYTAGGSTTEFSFPYLFYYDTDLEVYVTDTSGTTTLKELTTDYTVSGMGSSTGGTVTFNTAPTSGYIVSILRIVDTKQELDLENGEGFDANTMEKEFDNLAMGIQQLTKRLDNTICYPLYSTETIPDVGELVVEMRSYQTGCETAYTNCTTALTSCQTAVTISAASATAAAGSSASATTAQLAAEAAETTAVAANTAAQTAASSAASSATAASTSATNAATSETNAANSASSAAMSATASASSATSSRNSATASSNSATAASTSETNAATYASNAATSESNASTSATAASTSETNASISASNAATSESNAKTYKDSAYTYSQNAFTYKASAETARDSAVTSANNALTSADNASTSATNAATSETNAATSATAAASSATDAKTAATNAAAYQYRQADCRLTASGTTLTLARCGGKFLPINGSMVEIPSAGVTLSVSGKTASTIYNVYAYLSGATLTLELSTTASAVNTTTGIAQKSGDATRTLVGKIRTNTSGALDTSNAWINCLSYFNRRNMFAVSSIGSVTTSATSATQLSSSFVDVITWLDETIDINILSSRMYNNTNGCSTNLFLYKNGSACLSQSTYFSSAWEGQGCSVGGSCTDIEHIALTAWGYCSGGTASFDNTVIWARTRG